MMGLFEMTIKLSDYIIVVDNDFCLEMHIPVLSTHTETQYKVSICSNKGGMVLVYKRFILHRTLVQKMEYRQI